MTALPGGPTRVLVTGAAGLIGGYLRERMAAPGRLLRLLDTAPLHPAAPGERVELVQGSVTDADAMAAACASMDALVHLAGISSEGPWDDILSASIDGTRVTLDAAVAAGISRVVLASSNHAVGFTPRPADGSELPDDLPPRPDTWYGVSKVAIEALGRLYADRFGLEVVALRIGSCRDAPSSPRELATWLSPGDAARLVEAALTAAPPGERFRAVWGISANTRRWWSLDGARALGYRPQDDAEVHAERFAGRPDGAEAAARPDAGDVQRVGGPFTTTPLGIRPA